MVKSSDNEFPSVLFDQQGSDPSTPAADLWRLYFKSGGLYHVSDTGAVVGPLAASAGSIPELPLETHDQTDNDGTVGVPTNNFSILRRIECSAARTVTTAYFRVGTASGNLDIGIYSADLATLHASTGSFACPAAGTRNQAFTGSFAMVAGAVYYLAMAFSNTTSRVVGHAGVASIETATGGWNIWGQSTANLPLATSPTMTWEAARGVPYIAVR